MSDNLSEDDLELEDMLDEPEKEALNKPTDDLELDTLETAETGETEEKVEKEKTEEIPEITPVPRAESPVIPTPDDDVIEKGEDEDMDALRQAVLKSIGTRDRKKDRKKSDNRDSYGSRSPSGSDGEDHDLEAMRRQLLAQR